MSRRVPYDFGPPSEPVAPRLFFAAGRHEVAWILAERVSRAEKNRRPIHFVIGGSLSVASWCTWALRS